MEISKLFLLFFTLACIIQCTFGHGCLTDLDCQEDFRCVEEEVFEEGGLSYKEKSCQRNTMKEMVNLLEQEVDNKKTAEAAVENNQPVLPGAAAPASSMKMTSLSLKSSSADKPCTLNLQNVNTKHSMGVYSGQPDSLFTNAAFAIIKDDSNPILSFQSESKAMTFAASSIRIKDLQIQEGAFSVQGVTQWRLVAEESFESSQAPGWTNNSVTVCGGVSMLGGYCKFSMGNASKEYTGLPANHKHIRIVANFHFIDAWSGETAYMKANVGKDNAMEYLWTDSYDFTTTKGGVNICGGKYGEAKFNVPIDVIAPHIGSSVTIAFGSTLDQEPCYVSFGISVIQIYVK